MNTLPTRFSFLTKSFTTSTQTNYVGGTLYGDEILISQQRNQFIMTVNNVYQIVSIGSLDEIIAALIKLQSKEAVKPNEFALIMRSLSVSKNDNPL